MCVGPEPREEPEGDCNPMSIFMIVHKFIIETVQDFFDQVGHQTTNASIGNKH